MPSKRKPYHAFFFNFLELTELIETLVAPLNLVETHIQQYHSQGVSFDKMAVFLRTHYDTDSYGLGYISSFPTFNLNVPYVGI
jgi:hypothetical protein